MEIVIMEGKHTELGCKFSTDAFIQTYHRRRNKYHFVRIAALIT